MSDIIEEYVGAPAGAGGGGGGSQQQRAPIEYPDSLHSKQFANFIDLLCEGEIYGLVNQTDPLKSIYLNDIPIMSAEGIRNYSGVTMQERKGTQSQVYMDGFSSIEAEVGVGVQIKYGAPHTIRITNPNATALRVTIGFPSMVSQNSATGDTSGTTVKVSLAMQTGGTGGYAPITAGFETLALTPNGPDGLNTGGQTVSGDASVKIVWNGIDNGQYGQIQSCSYSVEYRRIGAASWTVHKTGTFSGYLTGGVDEWSWGIAPVLPYATSSITIPLYNYSFYWYNAPAYTHEFRVVKTSGTGTLSMPSGTAPRLTSSLTVTGKTTSKYQRSYRIPLVGNAPWDIRISRDTVDSTTSSLSNNTWWDSYTEIIETKLSYPNSALIGMSIDAEQLNDVPKRGYDIKGLLIKVPTNYFPTNRAYTRNVSTGTDMGVVQVWDGNFYTTWSDNPAWCFYDLVTADRYGLGKYIPANLVDKWGLYEVAQYCDQLVNNGFGSTEPRFTCNVYLQTREEAYKVVNTMASIFRGMAYWARGQLLTVQDAPKSPIALFSRANVIGGEFNYEGSSVRARHTVALVSWNDPAENYGVKIEYVEDEEGIALYGINQTDVIAVGCTSRGQAHRVGRWLLYTERLESEIISFKTGLDGLTVYPGAIIKTSDPIRSGKRYGGRVVTASQTLITIDAPYIHDAGVTYTISVVLPDGIVESRTVSSPGNITTSNISPTVAFSKAPQKNSMWILSEDNLQPQLWRVISIKEVEGTQAEITALAYRADKFDIVENDLEIQDIPISSIRSLPSKPTQGTISDSIYRTGVSICTKLTVSWDIVQTAVRYLVRYRLENDNWITTPDTKATSIDILNVVDLAVYTVRVYSVNSLGRESSEFLEFVHTVVGKTAPPSNVLVFTPTITRTGVVLEWGDIDDIDRDLFCITDVGTDTNTTPPGAAPGQKYTVAGLTYTLPPQLAGSQDYFIRAIDTTGHYSTVFKSTTFTVAIPSTPIVGASVVGTVVTATWGDCVTDHNILTYEVRRGNSWADSNTITSNNSLTAVVPADWAGSSKVLVKAVDIAGNYSVAGEYTLVINVPSAPVITSLIRENVLTAVWGDCVTSLPIASYEVRRGSTWESADIVGTTSSLSHVVPANWVGSSKIFVRAKDTSNNYSTVGEYIFVITMPSTPIIAAAPVENTLVASWADCSTSLRIASYEVRRGSTWESADIVGTTSSLSHTVPANWVGSSKIFVRAKDTSNNYSTVGEYIFVITIPSTPVVTASVVDGSIVATWNNCATSLNIDTYEVRRGGSWINSTAVTTVKGLNATIPADWARTSYIFVKAKDTSGNYSVDGGCLFDITPPEAPVVYGSLVELDALISWTTPNSLLPIVSYEVRWGVEWSSGTSLGKITATSLRSLAKGWTGSRNFYVTATNSSGHEGAVGTYNLIINPPARPVITSEFEGTSVRLKWDSCFTSLPIDYYDIRRGGTFETATPLGKSYTTGFTVLVDWKETATFWVKAYDGNENSGEADDVVIEIIPGTMSTPLISFQGVEAVVSWATATQGSLPIAGYEVRTGESWVTGALVGKTTDRFQRTPANWANALAGQKTFWVVVVDSVGLESTAQSVIGTILKPSTVTSILLDSLNTTCTINWNAPITGTLDIDYYEVSTGGVWSLSDSLGSTKTTNIGFPINWAGTSTFWVVPVDVVGNRGPEAYNTFTITPPTAVSLLASIALDKVELTWDTPSSMLPIDYYDIRYDGVSWSAATSLTKQSVTDYRVSIDWLGPRKFWVNAININKTAGTAGWATVDVLAPDAPIAYATIVKDSIDLTWTTPASSLSLVEYRIRYGNTWGEGVNTEVSSDTNTLTVKGTWLGERTYWIAAADVNNNVGEAGLVTINISAPIAPPNFRQQTIDNNVLLYWDQIQGTLPTTSYEIRKGSTWAGATLIGQKSGGFTTVFETAGGTFTYWITAIDTAGNYGAAGSQTATVNQPPDYILKDNFYSALDATLINGYSDSVGMIVPVNNTETYQGHFTAIRVASMSINAAGSGYAVNDLFNLNTGTYTTYAIGKVISISGGGAVGPATGVTLIATGTYTVAPTVTGGATVSLTGGGSGLTINTTTTGNWPTPQAQVDANYPVYIQPNRSPATYTEVVDYGTLLASNKITVTPTTTYIVGAVSSTCVISISTNNSTWTDYPNVWETYAQNFRYVKVAITYTAPNTVDLALITKLNIRLDSKLKTITTTLPVIADVSGTYTQTGTAITVTAAGTWVAGRDVSLDFTSGAAPDNVYEIATGGSGTFTVTSPNSTTTSGNCTIDADGTPFWMTDDGSPTGNVIFIDVDAVQVSALGTVPLIALYNFVDSPNPTVCKVLFFNTAGVRQPGTASVTVRGF